MKKLLCIALAAAAGGAHAQTPALRTYCDATPEERAIADSTAFMIQKVSLINNGNGTYRVNTTPFTSDGPGYPICPSDPLYGTPQAPNGRTAFLVGDSSGFKAMVTAPHATTAGFNPNDFAVIFGLHDTLVGGTCQPPNFSAIPAANVYFPPSMSVIYNSYSASSPRPADYMLFQLDRDVPSRKALPLRRDGKPELGDPLLVPGHYARFGTQIGTGATIEAITPLGLDIGTVPAVPGSSGSPVYNLRKKLVETVVAAPATGFQLRQKPGDTCYTFLPMPPNLHFINNGNLSSLVGSGTLPSEEVTISPTAPVLHTGAVGGVVTNRTTQFTVTPRNGTGVPGPANQYRIVTHGPAAIDISPTFTFTAAPGSAPQTFTSTMTTDGVACGAYNVDLAIVKHGSTDDGQVVARVPHRLELGLNDFAVAPLDAWTPSSLGPPFQPTRTLTIANPRATPVSISVTADQSWIKINNAASATLSLAAAGSSGSSGTVTLKIDDSFGGAFGAAITRTAKVRVQSAQPECDVRGATVVDVVATAGRASRSATIDAFLDGPGAGQTFGPPVEIPLDFALAGSGTADHYVADADLDIGFYSDNMLGWPIADTDTMLKIEVVAPDNTIAAVWDRNNASASYFGKTTIPYGAGHLTIDTLRLDDATTPSLGPNPLSTLNGKLAEGTWKVRIYSTTNGVIPMWLQLTLKRS